MFSYILICIAMESWTLSLFMAGPKSSWKQQELSRKGVANIADENNRTTSFGEEGLFICRHIYFGKQLLLQINNCC